MTGTVGASNSQQAALYVTGASKPSAGCTSQQAAQVVFGAGTPSPTRVSQLGVLTVYGPPQTHYVHTGQQAALVTYACGYKRPPHNAQQAAMVVYSTTEPAARDVPAWSFHLDGHIFYVLDLKESGTFLYDLTTDQWCEFKTANHYGWNMLPGTTWGPENRIAGGDASSTSAWELGAALHEDEGFRTISHFVTGGIPTRNRVYKAVESVRISGSFGNLDEMTEEVQATFTMRFSDDWGKTYSNDYTLVLVPDDWGGEIAWRSLGSFMAPGRIFEFEDFGGLLRIDGVDIFIQDFDNG